MGTNVYRDTIYASVISKLTQIGQNKDNSQFEICPNEGCETQLYSRYSLYVHIEEKHSADKRHSKIYFNPPYDYPTFICENVYKLIVLISVNLVIIQEPPPNQLSLLIMVMTL